MRKNHVSLLSAFISKKVALMLLMLSILIFPLNAQNLEVNNGQTLDVNSSASYEYTYVGYNTSSNTLTISGSGVVLSNSYNFVSGYGGGSNITTISSGAALVDATGYSGYGYNNNQVVVTGSGSTWSNTGLALIGQQSSSNSLTISDGATVSTPALYIGYLGNSNSITMSGGAKLNVTGNTGVILGNQSSGNQMTVSGSGTLMSNVGPLNVGYTMNSSNNSILIENGGVVQVQGAVGPLLVMSVVTRTTLLRLRVVIPYSKTRNN